jgi:predicted NBD/HSP70 family sugar kinase
MLLPVKATHQRTREHNVRLVLHTLAEMGPISRADIARRTHLTRTTVSDVMVELFADGLVEEVGRGPSSGGKAPILLRVPRDARQLIGVDVGDGQVRGAIVNLAGEIHHREEEPLGGRDGVEALVRLERLIDRLVSRAGGRPLGIGIGAPGLVDTSTGTVRWAVHLDWRDLPLGARLRARTGLPVYVANDSQAAALAEWTFGRHAPTRGMIVVKVGTGIGAGIIIDGRLYQGDGFGAGEIGHTHAGSSDLPCRCGRRGCLETVASLPATLSRAADQLAVRAQSSLAAAGTVTALTLEDLLAAFNAGDALAIDVVLESGAHLGQTLGGVIGALDIHDIVLIGAMTAFGDAWLAAVQVAAQGSSLALLSDHTRISIGRLGADVVELGAAALLMTAELGLSMAA